MPINRRNFVKSLGILGVASNLNTTIEIAKETTDFNFTAQPFLQNFTPNSITIITTLNKPCMAWVEIINKDGSTKDVIYQEQDGMRNANDTLFKFVIPHNNTNFKYRVVAKEILTFQAYKIEYGQQIQSEIIETKLPRIGINDDSTHLLILNDIHENVSTYNDLYSLSDLPRKDMVILNGDSFHYVNTADDIINKLNKPAAKSFGTQIPFIVVRGNHETRGTLARNFKKFYDYPDDNFYHSFLMGPVYVIILDGGEDKPDNHPVYGGTTNYDNYRLKQKTWLSSVLNSKERKQAKHTIIINHIPWIHSDDWHGTQHNYECFHELANNHKVDALISGHTHEYSFHPPNQDHNYCVVIGGGPKNGKRTFVELSADKKNLTINLKKDDGTLINSFSKK